MQLVRDDPMINGYFVASLFRFCTPRQDLLNMDFKIYPNNTQTLILESMPCGCIYVNNSFLSINCVRSIVLSCFCRTPATVRTITLQCTCRPI